MAGVNVSVAPEIINWVIEKIQFSTVNNSVFELLNKWKSGEKVPTFNQIEDVSKKTNIPFGYFFLEKPPVEECKIVEYRTLDSIAVQNPSRNLIDTVDMMSNAQEWMIDYVKENGQEPLSFVGTDQKEKGAMKIAAHIRSELHLSLDWFSGSKSASDSFRTLRQRLEDAGIMVMMNGIVGTNTHRKLSLDNFVHSLWSILMYRLSSSTAVIQTTGNSFLLSMKPLISGSAQTVFIIRHMQTAAAQTL